MVLKVAVFPARGGSKRIPFKNGRDFHGKPTIAWPIIAAQESGEFDRLVVSTDNTEIAEIARSAGAETPFLRDSLLADDQTGTKAVVVDAIERLNLPDDAIVACIYPTAVFITPDDLSAGVAKLSEGSLPWVLTVCEFAAPIQRAYRRAQVGVLAVDRDVMPSRSQDLEPHFHDAGQFYFAQASTWKTPGAHSWDGAMEIVLPRDRCVDIDTEEDWQFALKLFEMKFPEKMGLSPT